MSRRSASGLIATAVPTSDSIGTSLKLSEYAVQRRRLRPSRIASERTAWALPVPCRMSPTSRPVNTPSTDSATVPSAPVRPSRRAIVSASSNGVAVTSHTCWPASRCICASSRVPGQILSAMISS